MLGQHARIEGLGIEADAKLEGGQPNDDGRRQGHQMDGIDPRQPRPEERAIVEAPLGPGSRVDVTENESGQDEEQVDAEIALGRQAEPFEVKIQMVAEMVDEHP